MLWFFDVMTNPALWLWQIHQWSHWGASVVTCKLELGKSPGQWCCRGNWDVLPSTGGTRKANFWSISPDCVVFSPCKLDTQQVRNKLWATGLEAFDSPYQWRICQFGEVVLAYVKSSNGLRKTLSHDAHVIALPSAIVCIRSARRLCSQWDLEWCGWLECGYIGFEAGCPQTGSLSPVAGESWSCLWPTKSHWDPWWRMPLVLRGCWGCCWGWSTKPQSSCSLCTSVHAIPELMELGGSASTRAVEMDESGRPTKQAKMSSPSQQIMAATERGWAQLYPREADLLSCCPIATWGCPLDVSDAFLTAKQGTPTAVACYREFGLGTAWAPCFGIVLLKGKLDMEEMARLLLSTCSTQRPSARTISFRRLVGCGWLFLHWLQLLPSSQGQVQAVDGGDEGAGRWTELGFFLLTFDLVPPWGAKGLDDLNT